MRPDNTNNLPASKTSSHPPRRRERLKAAHRRAACRLGVIFDTPELAAARTLSKLSKSTVRRHVTRLANLAGTGRAASVAETYTRAMFALYAQADRGEDVRQALRVAALIEDWTRPSMLVPPP